MKKIYQVIIIIIISLLLVSCGGDLRGAKYYETYIPENIVEIKMEYTKKDYRNERSTIREDFTQSIIIDDEYRIDKFKGIISNLRYKKTYKKINKNGFNEKIFIKVYYKDNDVIKDLTYILYNYGGKYSYFEIDDKIIYIINYRLHKNIISMFEHRDYDIYE